MGQGSSSRYTSGSSGSSDTIILDEPVSPSTDVEFQAKLLKLITMSKSTELPIQRAVAECLANEAMLEERRALIVNLGGLDLLQTLIMSKDPEVQRLVTHTLANLAVSDHNQLEIAKNLDLIQALISLLGSTFPATQRQAAKAIANLAVKSENKHILLKHNALPPLLHLASSGMSNIQTEALAAIANLSVDDDNEVRAKLLELQRDNYRKALAADIELKMRAMYYGRIDVSRVEGTVKDIMANLPELEDAQFLLDNASKLFPKEAKEIKGSVLFKDLVNLRQAMLEDRAAAVSTLQKSLMIVYPDREPHHVEHLTRAVARLLRIADDIRMLASDAGELFPPEFNAAKPKAIYKAFKEIQKEKGI